MAKAIKPYNDETMTYDFEEHRYILTTNYVLDKMGIDLTLTLNTQGSSEPQKVAQYFLDRISSNIYEWIYQHNSNNIMQEFYLACSKEMRVVIRRAMLEQVAYVLNNGDISLYGGVNVKNGQIMDKKAMHNADIGINVEKELSKIVPEIGIAIVYQGWIPTPLNFKVREEY